MLRELLKRFLAENGQALALKAHMTKSPKTSTKLLRPTTINEWFSNFQTLHTANRQHLID